MDPDLEPKIRWKTSGAAALLGLVVVALAGCIKPAPANTPANAAAPNNAAAAPAATTPAGGPAAAPAPSGGLILPPAQPPGAAAPPAQPPGGAAPAAETTGPATSPSGATGRWDSIAVDDARGSSGSAAGYGVGTAPTQDAAQQAAMSACQRAGNNNCQVRLTYATCGAYASSRTRYGTGEGDTTQQAQAAAMANCGSQGCQLTVSDCVGQ